VAGANEIPQPTQVVEISPPTQAIEKPPATQVVLPQLMSVPIDECSTDECPVVKQATIQYSDTEKTHEFGLVKPGPWMPLESDPLLINSKLLCSPNKQSIGLSLRQIM